MKAGRKRLLALALVLIMCASLLPGMALAATEYSVTLEAPETVTANEEFTVNVVLNGEANAAAPAAASAKLTFSGATFVKGSTSMTNGQATNSGTECVVSFFDNTTGKFDADGKLTIATFTFKAGTADATFTVTEAVAAEPETATEATVTLPISSTVVKVNSSVNIITSIKTEQDLRDFAASVNAGADYTDVTVTLMNDITMTDEWTPMGSIIKVDNTYVYNCFNGTFDGGNHKISGLKITINNVNSVCVDENNNYYAGLFAYTNGASIKDVAIDGIINITTDQFPNMFVGSIVGYAEGTTITNCTSNVAITAKTFSGSMGGIAGQLGRMFTAKSTINKCTNYGNLSITEDVGNSSVGGVVGRAFVANLEMCGNYGNVTTVVSVSHNDSTESGGDYYYSRGYQGGILGYTNAAPRNVSVQSSFNLGGISGAGQQMGGIAGACNNIVDCYSIADITGNTTDNLKASYPLLGGIVGNLTDGTGLVKNCYAIGNVSSTATEKALGEIIGNGSEKQDNCYSKADSFTAETLGNSFKDDINSINSGYPLLIWQADSVGDETYSVIFNTTPAKVTISVYSDAAMTELVNPGEEGYILKAGTYYYKAVAEGYMTETGSFTVSVADVSVSVTLREASTITFNLSPVNAQILVSQGGTSFNPVSGETPNVFLLYKGATYSYTAKADGYNSTTREFTVTGDTTIDVTLTQSYQGQVEQSRVITPSNVPYTITEGGSYDLEAGDFESGYVYINTTEPVTIIGSGIATSSMSEDLHFVCQTSGVNLTLQDVYISNVDGKANMIDFQGSGNTLAFAGTSILDQDSNAAGYAMIHVPDSAELTVTGGTLYLYKREQGAGIGGNGGAGGGEGQTAETNGTINIIDATIFGKNSKQGALIGAGAQAGSQRPGDITIEDSALYLIAISRGGAIGGSAGSGGASSGTNVTVSNSQITINVDWSGSAIGGGGYDGGNDSDGGTLIYESGSVRTFIDVNALGSWNVTEAGVNGNKAITASIENSSGAPLYLLMFNTEALSGSSFTVKDGNNNIYSGGLHSYAYVNEALEKDAQISINYTLDNWTSLDDPNLYLYLTGEDHTLTVNGKEYAVTWDESTKTFTVKDSSGNTVNPGGGGGGGATVATPTTTNSEVASTTNVSGDTATVTVTDSNLTKAAEDADKNTQLVVSAEVPASADVDTVTTTLPADGMKAAADSGASLKVETPVGDVVLSNTALKDLTSDGGEIKVTVSENDDGTTSVTVTVGGKEVDEISGGVKVAIPATGDGQVAVLVHEDGTKEIIKKSVVENGEAYVLLDGSAKIEIVDNGKKFEDVPDNAWFKSAVEFASSHELFVGVSETEFAPGMDMTRAMMATVLYRLEGATAREGETAFDDVESGTWYSDAVKWANDAGIVQGYDDETFGTEDEITREQIAVMFYRYAKYAGMDTSAAKTLSGFSDGSKTSEWAQDAMKWAVAVGLFKGDDSGALRPQDNATRAEVATLFMRMVELMVK